MPNRIALQLYSIRKDAEKDYESAVRKVAAMGYTAVETAGFPGSTPEKAARLFQELGLTVTSAHVPLPVGPNQQKVLETMQALGKPVLVCTQIGPKDVETLETIKGLCDRLNEGYEIAHANGLAYALHNHWWEFGQVEGRLVHDIMLEQLAPGVLFEIDTYWTSVAGVDPARVIQKLGQRAPLLHIKDGPMLKGQPQTALGEGKMDFGPILAAAQPGAWQVVELDECATDMMEAVQKSYTYLARH